MSADALRNVLAGADAVLFDFDGPVCSVFDGYPAPQITDELRSLARGMRAELTVGLDSASGPHALLLAAASDAELAALLETALQKAELAAVQTAKLTPGAAEALAACKNSGRLVAVVSNNNADAVEDYLDRVGLKEYVLHVEGRERTNPTLMKPSPYLIEKTIHALGVPATGCVFIGDQPSDIEAGRVAGTATIGYANKPGKADALLGADVVIDAMIDVAVAITAT